jgi:hypothetical protein
MKRNMFYLACSAFLLLSANSYAVSGDAIPKCKSSLSLSQACKGNSAAQKKRKKVVARLYSSLLGTMPQQVMSHTPEGEQLVKSIFETNTAVTLKGRVTPVGKYDGILGAEEYFWGLALSVFSKATNATVKSLIASDDKVAVEVNIDFCLAGKDCSHMTSPYGEVKDENGQLIAYTLTQTGLYTFNKKDHIIKYDLNILNMGAIAPPLPKEAICAYLILPPEYSQIPNSGHCSHFWNRQNQYPEGYNYVGGQDVFSAYNNCIQFMDTVPVGTWYRANSNSHVCRQLHMILTPYRDMHCGHSGPKGLDVHPILDSNGNPVLDADGYPTYHEMGGKCVDFSYGTYYTEGF